MTDKELDALRQRAWAMLKPSRIEHVRGVEETAAHLAQKYGADEETCRVAAMLHDCTKKLSLSEQLEICRKYGVDVDEMERESPELLHSKSGAAVAQYEFGASDEVIEAIKWHTTGKANMSLTEKIVCLADFIEPSRHFEGVEAVRREAERDLDGALIMAFSRTLKHLEEKGVAPHRNTRQALEFLLARR